MFSLVNDVHTLGAEVFVTLEEGRSALLRMLSV